MKEVLEYLDPKPGQNYIDCTLGNGGHAIELARRAGKVVGIDLDEEIIELAKERIKSEGLGNITTVHDNYRNIQKIILEQKVSPVNGILLDLGLSSFELQDEKRGFSFQINSPLDMRYHTNSSANSTNSLPISRLTAGEIINKWPESELARIFREYGEERYAKQIAREIVAVRHEKPIHTTFDLLLIIEQVYRNKPKPKIHFATKVFQALRIMVNDELGNIRTVLPLAIEALNAGGRLAVISFHSLEDRIVKDLFREEARGCICPPKLPICNCGHKPRIKILTKKPIIASDEEVRANPRSRSAKMRVVEKI